MPTTSLARDIQRCKAVTCDREKTLSATFSSLYRSIVLSRTRVYTSILNVFANFARVLRPLIVKKIHVASIIVARRIYGVRTLAWCDALCVICTKLGRIRLGQSELCD